MNFSQREADPRRHLVGCTFIDSLHAFIAFALVAGLSMQFVDTVRKSTKIAVLDETLRRAIRAGIGSTSAPLTSVCI